MKSEEKLLSLALALSAMDKTSNYEYDTILGYSSPIFSPKKHTVESYRSQQRRAKQRRKSRK